MTSGPARQRGHDAVAKLLRGRAGQANAQVSMKKANQTPRPANVPANFYSANGPLPLGAYRS
jgi:hypothetical protein